MKERPILFSAPMVLALLAGTKTQTRRAVKGDIPPEAKDAGVFSSPGRAYDGEWVWLDSTDIDDASFIGKEFRCPYGQPGDVLWVRENFMLELGHPKPSQAEGYRVHYMADGTPDPEREWGVGQPSIHLPRWASRLALRITDVRVQRLQDCSEHDARAEGLQVKDADWMPQYRGADDLPWHVEFPRGAYFALWDHINGPGAAKANPWVWAVSFEVVR